MIISRPAAVAIFFSLLVVLSPGSGLAGPIVGESARSELENYRDNYGGHFIDFTYGVTPIPSDRRLDSEFASTLGVTFSTFLDLNLNPLGPHNAYVSTGNGSATFANTLVGTPCVGCSDDGRYSYKIEFATPQRYAGLQRIWNTGALTSFFSQDGMLLHSAQNTVGSQFHGYVANTMDPSQWISRIEISGGTIDGHRQVGYSDDLFFGTAVPEPATPILCGLGGMCLVGRRRRRTR